MTTPPMETIPVGLCQCGCGGKTTIPSRTNKRDDRVAGRPMRFITGHWNSAPRLDFSDAAPFKIDGDYCKLIQLSRGFYKVVDAVEHKRLSKFTWRASWDSKLGLLYAENRRLGYMHRFLLGLTKGDPRTGDHVDPSRTWDDRRRNLRLANDSQQQHNKRRGKNNTSGYKGVGWDKRRGHYFAQITTNRKNRYLGSDPDPSVCAEMYRVAAEAEHGEFARSD